MSGVAIRFELQIVANLVESSTAEQKEDAACIASYHAKKFAAVTRKGKQEHFSRKIQNLTAWTVWSIKNWVWGSTNRPPPHYASKMVPPPPTFQKKRTYFMMPSSHHLQPRRWSCYRVVCLPGPKNYNRISPTWTSRTPNSLGVSIQKALPFASPTPLTLPHACLSYDPWPLH